MAQQTPKNEELGRQSVGVEKIVVTQDRWPQLLHLVGSSVTIINEEAIRSSQAIVVSDLLDQMPGISSTRNGGIGGVTSLNVRGAETHQTLVVIDGVKVHDPSLPSGGFNFAHLLVSDIERIEILRGAKSILWGQAIGSVINIVTRSPKKPLETTAVIEGGSRETSYSRIGTGGSSDHIQWQLSSQHYKTDGISSFSEGTEKDGYHNTGMNGRVRWKTLRNLELDLRGSYFLANHQFDGFPPPSYSFADTSEYDITKKWIGHGGIHFNLFNHRFHNHITYDHSNTHRDNFNPKEGATTKTFEANGTSNQLRYQGSVTLAEGWNTTFGLENEVSTMKTNTLSKSTADLTSGYAQIQGEMITNLILTSGLRYESHDTFGSQTLGEASLVWALKDQTTFWLSFGQSFLAPSLYQLYSQFGNLSLRPEKADSWDIGWQQHFLNKKAVLSITGFYRETQNQINYLNCASHESHLCSPGRFGFYDNALITQTQGIELSSSLKFGHFMLYTNYTHTNTKNTSSDHRGKQLTHRPRHMANLWLNYTWPFDVSTGVAINHRGKSFDDTANTILLDAYTLVDFRASWQLHPTLENVWSHRKYL